MLAKMDQLKSLYRTAEAIGEEALARHFDQLSQRQRELIREYFEQAEFGRTGGGRGGGRAGAVRAGLVWPVPPGAGQASS
jgi:hypothetical protein